MIWVMLRLSMLKARNSGHITWFLKEGNEITANESVYIENQPCQINLLLFSCKWATLGETDFWKYLVDTILEMDIWNTV